MDRRSAVLADALRRVGSDRLLNSPALCRNVLTDLFAGDGLSVFLLVTALEHGVPQALLERQPAMGADALVSRLSDDLATGKGLNATNANWAVATWATALGVIDSFPAGLNQRAPVHPAPVRPAPVNPAPVHPAPASSPQNQHPSTPATGPDEPWPWPNPAEAVPRPGSATAGAPDPRLHPPTEPSRSRTKVVAAIVAGLAVVALLVLAGYFAFSRNSGRSSSTGSATTTAQQLDVASTATRFYHALALNDHATFCPLYDAADLQRFLADNSLQSCESLSPPAASDQVDYAAFTVADPSVIVLSADGNSASIPPAATTPATVRPILLRRDNNGVWRVRIYSD